MAFVHDRSQSGCFVISSLVPYCKPLCAAIYAFEMELHGADGQYKGHHIYQDVA